MTALHYAQNTKIYYRKVLAKFNQFLGKRPTTSVTHVEIRQFLTHISEYGATLETTYRYLGVLRRFYDFLNLGGVVSYVPPRLVRMKSKKPTDLPLLTETQVKTSHRSGTDKARARTSGIHLQHGMPDARDNATKVRRRRFRKPFCSSSRKVRQNTTCFPDSKCFCCSTSLC